MSPTPLAYKYVMIVTMISFVNHYSPRLNMPFNVPLQQPETQRMGVVPPRHDKVMTFYGGGIRVTNYLFSFDDGFFNSKDATFTGHFGITKLEDDGMTSFGIPLLELRESSVSLMERASRMKYTVSTNDVYRMATNYLVALDIDQKTFGRNPITVDQGLFHSNRGLVPDPMICAYWGKHALRDPVSNGVAFEISAVSGDLLEMNVGNASGCKGLPLIHDLDKLIAISDEDFLKYSDVERSNLVARFATSPSLITPEVMNLSLVLTTNNFTGTKVRRNLQ